jgi:hypothetical protein
LGASFKGPGDRASNPDIGNRNVKQGGDAGGNVVNTGFPGDGSFFYPPAGKNQRNLAFLQGIARMGNKKTYELVPKSVILLPDLAVSQAKALRNRIFQGCSSKI